MSEITNKELAGFLKRVHAEMDAGLITNESIGDVLLAAERLAAMPDVGEQEPFGYGFTDLNGVIRFFRKEEDANQAAIDVGEPGNYCPIYTQPQQPAPDVTIKDLRELINHFYDRRPDTSTNLLADEILNKYKVTQKC